MTHKYAIGQNVYYNPHSATRPRAANTKSSACCRSKTTTGCPTGSRAWRNPSSASPRNTSSPAPNKAALPAFGTCGRDCARRAPGSRHFCAKPAPFHRYFQPSVSRPWELGRPTTLSPRTSDEPMSGSRRPKGEDLGGRAMNWSMYTADRTTHLKIVVVGLTAALLMSVIGISAHATQSRHRRHDRAGADRDQGRRPGGLYRSRRRHHPLTARLSRSSSKRAVFAARFLYESGGDTANSWSKSPKHR